MARRLPKEFGVEGELFVDAKEDPNDPMSGAGQAHTPDIIDYNRPPRTQPSLWNHWIPTDDGCAIYWDGGEKFYEYVAWIKYLIDKVLAPRGYTLDGEVDWEGEDSDDRGMIVVRKNKVFTKAVISTYGPEDEA
jgi:hypothetical protein